MSQRLGRVPALHAEKHRTVDLINGQHYSTEDEVDALMDRWGNLERQALANPATTLADAIALVEWALEELLEHGFDTSIDDQGKVVPAMLNKAIGVLRMIGGAA